MKTKYPGVFYREAKRIGIEGTEKVYYVVFKKNGKVYEEKAGRQSTDAMTPARAARIRSEIIDETRLSRKELLKRAETNTWTIKRLWSEYKAANPGLRGIRTDENRFQNYIEPNFGAKDPKDLSPYDIDRLRSKLLKTRSPGTAKNVLELLRRIVNFGAKKRLCDGPGFTIEMPEVNNEKTECLTSEELTGLLEAIDRDPNIQVANLMKMALFTGMRRGDLFKLKWEDIDFDRGFIRIRDPKDGPEQEVPLNDAAGDLLKAHPKSQSPYVFPGRGGRQRTDVGKAVNRIKKYAGLPKEFRPLHGLRHSYASVLASSGKVDMHILQQLLTHKTPAMTQRYAHLRNEALKRASNLVGDILGEVHKKD